MLGLLTGAVAAATATYADTPEVIMLGCGVAGAVNFFGIGLYEIITIPPAPKELARVQKLQREWWDR